MGVGERGRNRTFNLLIKSQLLCQLSYAPLRREQAEVRSTRELDLVSDFRPALIGARCRTDQYSHAIQYIRDSTLRTGGWTLPGEINALNLGDAYQPSGHRGVSAWSRAFSSARACGRIRGFSCESLRD